MANTTKKIATLAAFVLCTHLITGLIVSDPVKAQSDLTLGGGISICDRNTPLNGTVWEDSTGFAIWVRNATSIPPFFKWTRYPSTGWYMTDKGYYTAVLPVSEKDVNWSHESEYRIEIDGSPWGLKNTNATSNGTGSVKATGGGVPVPPDGTPEFTPYGNVSNSIAYWTWGPPIQTDDFQQWDIIINCADLIPADITVNGLGPFNAPFTDPIATVNVFQGDTVTLTSSVRNVGTTFVNRTSTIMFWNNTGGVLDWNVTGYTMPVPALGTQIPAPNLAIWPGTTSIDIYNLYITVDYPTVFSEYNTISGFPPDYGNITEMDDTDIDVYPNTNNTVRVRVIVGALPPPDLIPGNTPVPADILFDGTPVTGASGSPPVSDQIEAAVNTVYQISSPVTNVGSGSAVASHIFAFYNCTQFGGQIDPPFKTVTVSAPLNPSESSTPILANWTSPSAPDVHTYICLKVDYSDNVAESEENNNTYIIHVHTSLPGDIEPPRVYNVLIDDAPSATYSTCSLPSSIELKATIDDEFSGASDVGGANYTMGAANWLSSVNMDPSDGSFDFRTEIVNVTVDITALDPGTYYFYVYGWDEVQNYNATSAAFAILNITDGCAPLIDYVLINGFSPLTVPVGGGPVVVTSRLNDSLTGNSNIISANYTVGAQAWPGAGMSPIIPPFDSLVEEVTSGSIDISGWSPGAYSICVYGSDENGNDNVTGKCASLLIASELSPPEIRLVHLNGAASLTEYLSSLPATITLTATIDDSNTGGSFIGTIVLGGANYTVGFEAWASAQPMDAQDGTWSDDVAEAVSVEISTPTSFGVYTYCVYGWDQWLNYNRTGFCAQLNISDDIPPEINNVTSESDSFIEGGEATIYAEVIDNVADSINLTVFINISKPDGSILGNFSMIHNSVIKRFEFTSTFDTEGTYTFTIWAGDVSQNWNHSSSSFVMEKHSKPRDFMHDWWWVIVLVVIVVIVLVLGLLLLKRRGKKDTEEQASPSQENN